MLAEDLVRNLDTQTPQVLIEARIVEARSTFLRDIGVQWGGNTINSAGTGNPTGIAFPSTVGVAGGAVDNLTNSNGLQLAQSGAASPNYVVNMPAAVGTGSGGALGITLGSLNGAINVNLRLSSLENTGQVRIISAPKIMTLDNIEASIEQGVSIPISQVSAAGVNTVFVDAKLNLTVKPHVTNEGSVVMNVAITRNEPDFVNVGARGDPTILKKQAKTEMLVRDGDTAVIGGIYTRNTGLSYTKVPWFAEIPILGWLFKNRRENDDRTELLIFITPRIVNRSVVAR
jgi:type IV pilus assembly protein PilQ